MTKNENEKNESQKKEKPYTKRKNKFANLRVSNTN